MEKALKIILIVLLFFYFLVVTIGSYSSNSFGNLLGYWFYLIIPYFIFSFIVSIFFIINSIYRKKLNLFCFYIIFVLLSFELYGSISRHKSIQWKNEMYEIAEKIENYFLNNELKNIDDNELTNLGITEKIEILFYDNGNYRIYNRRTDLEYNPQNKTVFRRF